MTALPSKDFTAIDEPTDSLWLAAHDRPATISCPLNEDVPVIMSTLNAGANGPSTPVPERALAVDLNVDVVQRGDRLHAGNGR